MSTTVKKVSAIEEPSYDSVQFFLTNGYYNDTEPDINQNLYVVGDFSGTVDFNSEAGVDNKTSNGSSDAFLSKFSQDGTYQWTKTWGGTGADIGKTLILDSSGNIYVSGSFSGTVDFNPDAGVDNKTSNGSSDAFLSKFSQDGTYQWTKTWGGTGADSGNDTAVDANGNLYLSGYFTGTVDFNPDAGVENKTSNGSSDMFLTKFSQDGTYQWTKTWGGTGADSINNIAIDNSNNVYVAAYFSGTVDFNPDAGVDNKTSNGSSDAFLSKFSQDGTYQWVKTWGGTGADDSMGITIDTANNVYVGGNFTSTVDFNPDAGVENKTSNGLSDMFLTKLSPDGTYQWTKTWGGTGTDSIFEYNSIVHNQSGKIFVTGFFTGTVDFNPDSQISNVTSNGNRDIFISSFNSSGELGWVKTFGGTGLDESYGLTVTNTYLYVFGYLSPATIDFNPLASGGEFVVSSATNFLLRYKYPPQTTISGNSYSQVSVNSSSPTNPNHPAGWKKEITFGPKYIGIPKFETVYYSDEYAGVLFEPSVSSMDLHVTVTPQRIPDLDKRVPRIPYPWEQGYNVASEIWNIDIVSAFNGYPVKELDKPGIIVLTYDPQKLYGTLPSQLKIAFYNETTKRWQVIANNTVISPSSTTVANTSKQFGVMAVVYGR